MTKSDIYCTFEGIWDDDVPSIFTVTVTQVLPVCASFFTCYCNASIVNLQYTDIWIGNTIDFVHDL